MSSILLQAHRARGAEIQSGDDPQVLAFGEVPDEYAAASTGCLLFDQTERGSIRVGGAERAVFLHRLLAGEVRGLEPGTGNRNLLLSPKGKVLFDFDLAVRESSIHLSTPPGSAPGLLAALDMYHFSEDLEFEDTSLESAPLALTGPAAGDVLSKVLGLSPLPEDRAHASGTFDGVPVTVTSLPVAGSPGWRVDGGATVAERLFAALVETGATPGGLIVYDILRVEACQAEPGVDVDDTIYPQEARLEAGFHLEKGCYVGQEVVAKIDTYGGLNKRLSALRVSHDDPVPRGTRLIRDENGEERDLGVASSWAYSFVLDTGLLLGYLKRKHQAVGTEFRLGSTAGTARVVEMPVRSGAVPVTGEFE